MISQGFIKLHRQIIEWEWYGDINVSRLFIHCLLKANHKDNRWQGKIIKKGSFITSYENLSIETGLSVQQVRTAINKLKLTNEITYHSTSQYSIITINNWDKFQLDNTQNNKQTTNEQQTNNKQITTNKNDNNEKNEEEVVEREKLYGEYQNVFLSESNYNKLLGISLSKKLLEETIDNLSSKIEEGAEQPYKNDCPNAHFIRLKKYIDYRRKHPEKFEEQEEFNPYEVGEYNAN